MPQKHLFGLIILALTIYIGNQVKQSDIIALMASYIPFFLVYLYIYLQSETWKSVRYFLWWSLILRIILVISFPALSDDIYRFVWDGRLWQAGINPFDHLPTDYMQMAVRPEGLDAHLYTQLNSPNYFTIYPPLCQFTFWLGAMCCPQTLVGFSIFLKMIFLCFEAGTIALLVKLLGHFRLPEKNALLYALNPLILIEGIGNLHFEVVMVFFLLLSLWCLAQKKYVWSALAMAMSISTKLLPLVFLPFLIRRLGWSKSIRYIGIVGITLVAIFVPLINEHFVAHFGESLDLYFRKFEFNASVYYMIRYLGYQWKGYNIIQVAGPILGFLSAAGILALAVLEERILKAKRLHTVSPIAGLPVVWLLAFTWYLLLTTTVHPWYLTLPVVLSVFTGFRYPILWSGLIMATYINYSYPQYAENMWVVVLEYLVVLSFFIWEWRGAMQK